MSAPYNPRDGGKAPKVLKLNAVWDTGATRSAITQEVIDKLGIKHTDELDIYTANGVRAGKEYSINVYLPNHVALVGVPVTDGDMRIDMLIGMDIISRGDFAVTNKFKGTWMTFQIPPTHSIDFVDEVRLKQGKPGFRRK